MLIMWYKKQRVPNLAPIQTNTDIEPAISPSKAGSQPGHFRLGWGKNTLYQSVGQLRGRWIYSR